MTSQLVVVGGVDDVGPGTVQEGDTPPLRIRYAPESSPKTSYQAPIEPTRLLAAVRRTEDGFVARAGALNAIGYGTTPEAALNDLGEAIRQYLEFIRDDKPRLAPSVAHHGQYVRLLDVPRGSWFAWVSFDASPLE